MTSCVDHVLKGDLGLFWVRSCDSNSVSARSIVFSSAVIDKGGKSGSCVNLGLGIGIKILKPLAYPQGAWEPFIFIQLRF